MWRQTYDRSTGMGYDDDRAPITPGPDGTACVGVLDGLAAVRDGAGR